MRAKHTQHICSLGTIYANSFFVDGIVRNVRKGLKPVSLSMMSANLE